MLSPRWLGPIASSSAFFDESMSLVFEPGEFRFEIGASSGDVRQKVSVQLGGEPALYLQKRIRATGTIIE